MNYSRWFQRNSSVLSWLIDRRRTCCFKNLKILWLKPTTERKLITAPYKSMNNWMCQLSKEPRLFTALWLREEKGSRMLDPEDSVEDKVVPCFDSTQSENTQLIYLETAEAKQPPYERIIADYIKGTYSTWVDQTDSHWLKGHRAD